MTPQNTLRRLAEHQAAGLALVDRAERLLARDDPRDAAALARARWEGTRALIAYALFKHRELFDPAVAGPDPARARLGGEMKARCEAMGERVRAHVRHWSATDVERHWGAYRSAALALAADLRRHLAEERRGAERLLGVGAEERETRPSFLPLRLRGGAGGGHSAGRGSAALAHLGERTPPPQPLV